MTHLYKIVCILLNGVNYCAFHDILHFAAFLWLQCIFCIGANLM